MLDQLFPRDVSERMRSSRLGHYLETFAILIGREGYAPSTIREQLRCLEHLSRWIQKRDIAPEDLDERVIGRFLAARRRNGYRSRSNGDTSAVSSLTFGHRASLFRKGLPQTNHPRSQSSFVGTRSTCRESEGLLR